MAMGEKEQFSASVATDVLASFRTVAKAEGRMWFEAALEDAMRECITTWKRSHPGVRPAVIAHSRDSLERNRKLYELLAQAEYERCPPSSQ